MMPVPFLLMLVAAFAPAAAGTDPEVQCQAQRAPSGGSSSNGSRVSQNAARAIFLAATKDLSSPETLGEVRVTETEDGAAWYVFNRTPSNVRGGGHTMRIDKCTGAMTQFEVLR